MQRQNSLRDFFLYAALALLLIPAFPSAANDAVEDSPYERTLALSPSENNPRNSEGDFIELRDGRILFVYTHFVGGAGDHDNAYLASRVSADRGRSWSTEDAVVLASDGGMNVMSVSLLRLQGGEVALFYLRKNATDDCVPLMRVSTDEAATWSAPVEIITDAPGYYVVNNDRVVQLSSGRLVVPAARHAFKGEAFNQRGFAQCFLSDDIGKSWRRSATVLSGPETVSSGLQEPGVVELKDGALLMLCRTSDGAHYRSRSEDGGDQWSPVERTDLLSPTSPATFERIPSTGDLLMAWNDHREAPPEVAGLRTPFTLALSNDEGLTWRHVKTLEDDPMGWYCYTAMTFVDDAVLLGHCAGNRRETNGLAKTQLTRFPVSWLYE